MLTCLSSSSKRTALDFAMLSHENIRDFLKAYTNQIQKDPHEIPPQLFLFKKEAEFGHVINVRYFDQFFLCPKDLIFWGDIIHEFVYSCRQKMLDFDGFVMFAVMLDSETASEANSFFGTYVYHVASNTVGSTVFDLEFNVQADIEPLDLFSDVDFSSTFYIH